MASLKALMDYSRDAVTRPQMTVSCDPRVAGKQKVVHELSALPRGLSRCAFVAYFKGSVCGDLGGFNDII